MRIVFDTEGNGLREDITQMWCFVYKDIDTKVVDGIVYDDPLFKEKIQEVLDRTTLLIGHNIINYDLPVLERLYGIKYDGELFDTLVVSRLLNPDRQGGHGLEAWGRRAKRYKPPIDDWSIYRPEIYHRCSEDIHINEWTYFKLLKEMEE